MPTYEQENKLVSDLADGDLAAFDALYYQYRQPVYANILKLVQQIEAAEDILQEVFATLWEHRQKIDQTKSVGGWLFVVSHNKAITYLKKKVRESNVIQLRPDLPEHAATEDQSDELYGMQMALIQQAVEHLPARKRDIFKRCRFEGQSAEEVSQLTGISVASVNDYLKQSTRFIRDYIRSNSSSSQLTAIAGLLFYLE